MVPDPPRPLTEHVARVRDGGVSSLAVLEDMLMRIERIGPSLNAYHEVFAAEARIDASRIDGMVAAGEDPGPLAGALIAVKDNIATTIGRTTCSSRMLEEWRSPFEATCVARICGSRQSCGIRTTGLNICGRRWKNRCAICKSIISICT